MKKIKFGKFELKSCQSPLNYWDILKFLEKIDKPLVSSFYLPMLTCNYARKSDQGGMGLLKIH